MTEVVKRDKKLGIVIHDKASLFSNGIIQNAYFFHQCCASIGYRCQFLCPEPNPSAFEHKGLSVKEITTDERIFRPAEYHTIVLITRDISKEMYDLLKRHKVGIVTLVCGNNYMFDQEDFVKGLKGTINKYLGASRNIDEQWLIPSFQYALDYMEIIRKKPAFIVPHLWSSDIIRDYTPRVLSRPESGLYYDAMKRRNAKLNIVILEPNLNMCKTGWMPLIAAEKLHTLYPDLIEFVYVFNFPSHEHAYTMTGALSLGSKLRKFERKSVPEILYFFNNEISCTPIFVSHQVLTHLNYLYYELLYYGFPLVHNSTMLDGCGYYFPENHLMKCVEQIVYAHKHHEKNVETHRDQAKEYLKRVDPMEPAVQKTFDQMITASIVNQMGR